MNETVQAFRPFAEAFFSDIVVYSIFSAIFMLVCCLLYYGYHAVKRSDGFVIDGGLFFRVLTKVTAFSSLPMAPALLAGAFFPDLLSRLDGVEIPLLIAGVAILWSVIEAIRQ